MNGSLEVEGEATNTLVIPAEAGIQVDTGSSQHRTWAPAFAGATNKARSEAGATTMVSSPLSYVNERGPSVFARTTLDGRSSKLRPSASFSRFRGNDERISPAAIRPQCAPVTAARHRPAA